MRTRVKICGITRPEDLEIAIESGADALGLICYPPSPRYVGIDTVRTLSVLASPFVTVVAVVVNPEVDEVRRLLDCGGIDVLQFHGDEEETFCDQFRLPWIKAVRMREDVDVITTARRYSNARGVLVDAWHADWVGGTGETFDWQRLAGLDTTRLVLAGGLNQANIGTAIETVQPFAVDVSTGVEDAPGIKNAAAMRGLMTAVREADTRRQAK